MKRKKRSFAGKFCICLALLMFVSIVSASHDLGSEYAYMIGTGFLEQFGPVITVAPNGETIELQGEGTFSLKPKSVIGNGTFIHRDSEGNIIGTGKWVAVKLITFKSYGSGTPQGFPEDFEGGRALIKVLLDPDGTGPSFYGTLRVTCTIGNKIPPKDEEGIRLSVRGIPINFDDEISGATLFIREE